MRQANINPVRAGWLDAYMRELNSGKWGRVLSVWFDEPVMDDIPWEPCAVCQITIQGSPMFIVVSEDIGADPPRLKLWGKYEKREVAYLAAMYLRPWNIRPTYGYIPTNSEVHTWLANFHEWDILRGKVR